ncbi:MAG TPA: Crp/Fnr family transcriptional regulator [Porticoccaceae bacterium]|nr:Crp/Fnr family transcriptional regulator [Porticoccaceae bacterium]HCO59237.1 Crp/Fnr family transcriptional regulator [Porticoccaceae bacterium]
MAVTCPHNPEVNCTDCRMNSLCLPIALELDEVERLNQIVQRGRPLQKDSHVYNVADEFSAIYAVRSGSIKTYNVSDQGAIQVTGFFLPGEIFGIDGIAHTHYVSAAVAMETSAICEIPFSRLEELSMTMPSLQRHFFKLMSKEITNDQQLITLLSKNSAEERVATLLLSISSRNAKRNLSSLRFRLPMSRADIGNYLGLTVETVSRVFSRFQKQGLLEVDKKEIEIKDIDALQELSNI